MTFLGKSITALTPFMPVDRRTGPAFPCLANWIALPHPQLFSLGEFNFIRVLKE